MTDETLNEEAMMSEVEGTIRAREAQQVIRDLLNSRGVPKWTWRIDGAGLHILVGDRQVDVPLKAGMTVYGIDAARRKVEALIDEMGKKRDRRQIDLENLIRQAPA